MKKHSVMAAKRTGDNRSYVSRIEKKALEKLKKLLEDNHL